jgi:hypothetical protein
MSRFGCVVSVVLLCSVWGCGAQFPSDFEVQKAPTADPNSGPGLAVRAWNATGANNLTTGFTLGTVRTWLRQ